MSTGLFPQLVRRVPDGGGGGEQGADSHPLHLEARLADYNPVRNEPVTLEPLQVWVRFGGRNDEREGR
ncbi:hypothetical protein GCM10027258_51710 [Amycolatopsis stemonae]